jgi:SAM-dependent methyltransferase
MISDPAMRPENAYDDDRMAAAYSVLEFPGTYYLAIRDLPAIIAQHVSGRRALDFGCGAGRSTAFVRRLGFEVLGVDISASMIERARRANPAGEYRLIGDGDFSTLPPGGFDLILSAFAFDNIAGATRRAGLLGGLRQLLRPAGRIIVLGSTPEVYSHEWVSFTTQQFPGNRAARSGDAVQIVIKDVDDRRPVVDYLWSHEDYLELFSASALELVDCRRPLGRGDEPVHWQAELTIPPWVIYVLRANTAQDRPGSAAASARAASNREPAPADSLVPGRTPSG